MAISKCDQFDFLIDIVPREELKPAKPPSESGRGTTAMNPDQVLNLSINIVFAVSGILLYI